MIKSPYPEQGQNSSSSFSPDAKERLLDALNKYYYPLKIFSGAMFIMAIVVLISFVVNIPSQLKDAAGTIDTIVNYIVIAVEVLFVALLVFGAKKFVQISGRVINDIANDDFSYDIGTITDKRQSYNRNDHTSRYSVYVNDIPCEVVLRNFYDVRLGDNYYIIYVKSLRFAFPIDV